MNRQLAQRMNSYRKYVITRGLAARSLEWNNAELVVTKDDSELKEFIDELKSEPGARHPPRRRGGSGPVHGCPPPGRRVSMVRSAVVSRGVTRFDHLEGRIQLELAGQAPYGGGVVGLNYRVAAS